MPTWNLRVDRCAWDPQTRVIEFATTGARGALGAASGSAMEFASLAQIQAAANISDEEIFGILRRIVLAKAPIAGITDPSVLDGRTIAFTMTAGSGSMTFT